jgi:hypothetical protein
MIDDAYKAEGKMEDLSEDQVQFLSSGGFAYCSGVLGLMQRERPAANIMVGGFYMEALQFSEAGHIYGGINIAGSSERAQLPFFLTACDYSLISDELFAASAYLSGDQDLIGSIKVQDYLKLVFIALLVGVVLFATIQNNLLVDFLAL